MLEYPSKYDGFALFKPIFNSDGNFIDYIFINSSNTFKNLFGLKEERLTGKKITDILIEYEGCLCDLKDIYFNMIPNTRKKYEKYMPYLNRWYMVSIFSDEYDFLLLVLNDITSFKAVNGEPLNDKGNVGEIGTFGKEYTAPFKQCMDYIDKRIMDKCAYLVFKDKLTDLYNRNFFEEELTRLDSERQLPVSIVVGDINGLKLINDAFGHFYGDRIIKQAAAILKKTLRKEDIVSRVGGDEFAAILPKTSEETASFIVDRIKDVCKNYQVDFIPLSISFGIAAKTISSESITNVLKTADDRMYFNKLKESKHAKIGLFEHIKSNLDTMSYESRQHHERLKTLSHKIAKKIGLADEEKDKLELLCEYHDIGKAGISKDVLLKKGRLDIKEWESVRKHCEIGYRILGASREMSAIDELVLSHHERWDGTGYPSELKGERIPVAARVFAIIDAYDAMVNDKPYRNRMSKGEALEEINSKAGKQFDPFLADIFVEIMKKQENTV